MREFSTKQTAPIQMLMDPKFVAMLSPGLETELYKASIRNLVDCDNKLRLNNFAYATRELMRHVLHRLAPTESVVQCSWYKNVSKPEQPDYVTRKQRACFAVQGGLLDEYVKNVLNLDTDAINRELVKAIDRLSQLTHIEDAVFGLNAPEVDARVCQTQEAMEKLFTTVQSCRQQILDALWEQIDDAVIDQSLQETLLAIDELASHHTIEEVYTDRVEITNITHAEIQFKATGSITAGLQWGSNSDVRSGDGALGSESFPFTCYLSSPVDDPTLVEAHEEGLLVDTSSWWDGYYDEEP